jgi:hypothetical protein
VIAYQCGNTQQALGAGRSTITGRFGPVFDPFDITVADGATSGSRDRSDEVMPPGHSRPPESTKSPEI